MSKKKHAKKVTKSVKQTLSKLAFPNSVEESMRAVKESIAELKSLEKSKAEKSCDIKGPSKEASVPTTNEKPRDDYSERVLKRKEQNTYQYMPKDHRPRPTGKNENAPVRQKEMTVAPEDTMTINLFITIPKGYLSEKEA